MVTSRKQDSEQVRFAAKYVAIRLVPQPSQKARLLRDVECRYKAPEIFYFIQEAATALLPIVQSLAAAYLYDKLRRSQARDGELEIEEVYERIETEDVVRYKKKVTRLRNRLSTHPSESNSSTRAALRTHETILEAVSSPAKGSRRLKRICRELASTPRAEIDRYLKKYRKR